MSGPNFNIAYSFPTPYGTVTFPPTGSAPAGSLAPGVVGGSGGMAWAPAQATLPKPTSTPTQPSTPPPASSPPTPPSFQSSPAASQPYHVPPPSQQPFQTSYQPQYHSSPPKPFSLSSFFGSGSGVGKSITLDNSTTDSSVKASQPPDEVTPLPTMRETGPPGLLPECVGSQPRSHPLAFYHLSTHPNALCCNRCHADRIAETPLAGEFIQVTRTGATCSFGGYRMKNALRSGAPPYRIQAILNSIPSSVCGHSNGTWFRLGPGAVCAHCYATTVADSAFDTIILHGAPGQCIFSFPYVQRAFAKLAHSPANFSEFSAAVERRLAAPPCGSQGQFFTPQRTLNFDVCEACVLDNAGYTRFESEFVPSPRHPPSCGLGTSTQLQVALETAVHHSDFGTFWAAASRVVYARADAASGAHSPIFHTLVTNVQSGTEFDICDACHAGFMTPMGLAGFFRHRYAPRGNRACDLCVNPAMMDRLVAAWDTSVWEGFRSAAMGFK